MYKQWRALYDCVPGVTTPPLKPSKLSEGRDFVFRFRNNARVFGTISRAKTTGSPSPNWRGDGGAQHLGRRRQANGVDSSPGGVLVLLSRAPTAAHGTEECAISIDRQCPLAGNHVAAFHCHQATEHGGHGVIRQLTTGAAKARCGNGFSAGNRRGA